ncbi:DNA primase [Sphingomonas sp. ID1715]|uniref:DNA primase n=1 Tax=Sphingomonas sp. ID1715 TaxID=1656898 RepID=UPI001487871E|nr:DNA primase [Sphingomonas sp. ID1715]NNM78175.1 DNA primase [Sphingomonas sp. ID1715]
MDGRVQPKATDGDLEGLDESQRAELHEYEGGGPSDGLVLTDMARDRGEDFVEDDRTSEIMPEEVDALGMSILSPEDLGNEVLDGDVDAELNDDLDDEI